MLYCYQRTCVEGTALIEAMVHSHRVVSVSFTYEISSSAEFEG